MPVAAISLPQIAIACERARLPRLAGQPFALVGTESVLTAVSDEAASFGIQPDMAASAARSLCQGLIVLPYDQPTYNEAAESVWDLLAVESSTVEPVSPELAFLEVTGPDAAERVRDLAKALAMHVHTSVFAGIGRSKIVARHACRSQRLPEDEITALVMVVPDGQEASALASVPLLSLSQITARTKTQLERRELKTLGDVLTIPPDDLKRQFKDAGVLLQKLAQGFDGDRVRPLWPPARIEQSWTFEEETNEDAQVDHALAFCAARIAQALQIRLEYCRSMALVVENAQADCSHGWETLSQPSRDTDTLTRAAQRLMRRMPLDGAPIRKVNLAASKISSGESVQLALLDDNESANGLPHERKQKMGSAIAYLREKYGIGAVQPASLGYQAKRLHLWTYSLTHERCERVRVVTDKTGDPVRYYRQGTGHEMEEYSVKTIQNRWHEAEWNWGKTLEKTCYRVIVDPGEGLYELHKLGTEWKMAAVAD